MNWIDITQQLPPEDVEVAILIYEDWSRHYPDYTRNPNRKPDESWKVCGGVYTTNDNDWYLPCKPGIKGGFDNIISDYKEGQLIYVVAWCPLPDLPSLIDLHDPLEEDISYAILVREKFVNKTVYLSTVGYYSTWSWEIDRINNYPGGFSAYIDFSPNAEVISWTKLPDLIELR